MVILGFLVAMLGHWEQSSDFLPAAREIEEVEIRAGDVGVYDATLEVFDVGDGCLLYTSRCV